MLVKNTPVYLAYILFPLLMLLSRYSNVYVPRNIIELGWFFCLFFSFLVIFFKGKINNFYLKYRQIILLGLYFFILASIFKFFLGVMSKNINLIPLFMSIKPVVYLLVFIFWYFAFRVPSVKAFVISGVILSIVIFLEMSILTFVNSSLSRPKGSGEINYDACLILLSLLLLDKYPSKFKIVIFCILVLGLLSTFSRTAIFAGGLIFFLSVKSNYFFKVVGALVGVIAIFLSFQIRGLSITSFESMDRYWMWVSGLGLYLGNFYTILLGFNWGEALNADVPAHIEWLWAYQAESWNISGIYPFNYHAFWLRILIDWGIFGFLILFICFYKYITSKTIAEKGVALLLIIEGLTMGLFYLSNVAVPLFFTVFLSGWFDSRKFSNV